MRFFVDQNEFNALSVSDRWRLYRDAHEIAERTTGRAALFKAELEAAEARLKEVEKERDGLAAAISSDMCRWPVYFASPYEDVKAFMAALAADSAAPSEPEPITAKDYDFCPHCKSSFSFAKPVDGGHCPWCKRLVVERDTGEQGEEQT